MKDYQVSLKFKTNDVTPIFLKPRPVPFAIKEAVGKELDRLEADGILEKVTHSNWAAPIVAVPKGEGQMRLCGDYKVTVNPMLKVDQYPLPRPEDLFASLAGGQKFTKLDLRQAYMQMILEEDSRQYVTINTHQGLYRYTRLPFGIAPAPAIFQRTMDTILQGIPHVLCYIDDLLITGVDDKEHLSNLEEVLKRLQQQGIRLKSHKCHFMRESVEYLGHRIDSQGLHTTSEKIKAIQLAPRPKCQQQLRSFLGLVHYYGKFIPNLAAMLHPMNDLLQKNVKWRWSSECEQAFQKAKKSLTSSTVLAHYDPQLPLRMAADASAYGVGAVISLVYPNGVERPIAYASRTLTAAERNYAQIEKEALSLIFGVRKFHQYVYGRAFTLITDHKPLTTILGPKKGIPTLAAARLQRWALLLSAYHYQIEYKSTSAHANADGLSRLPLNTGADRQKDRCLKEPSIFNVRQMEALPVTTAQLKTATRQDLVLSRVVLYTRQGWPGKVPDVLKPYWNRRSELSLEDGCLLWGVRVIVPRKLQERVLQEVHLSHPGIVRMKSLARSYVWWPKLDHDIEQLVKNCMDCQSVRHAPPVAPLHPWLWPTRPWQRIHVDFAGPFRHKMFLIVVDAHSKWPEVIEMKSTTSSSTIHELRRLFSTYGLPEQLVSDNGPQFTSVEFEEFLKGNGVKLIHSAPYHPSSNGLAERFVQTFKRARISEQHGPSFPQRLQNFLLTYRTTPHATTNETPSTLFLGRHVRTRLDLLYPTLEGTVANKQARQKLQHDRHAWKRDLFIGQRVMARNFRPGTVWVPGTITERTGPVSYLIQVSTGQLWKRHIDHIRTMEDSPQVDLEDIQDHVEPYTEDSPVQTLPAPEGVPAQSTLLDGQPIVDNTTIPLETPPRVTTDLSTTSPVTSPSPSTDTTTTRRYPLRQRKAPNRYQDMYL